MPTPIPDLDPTALAAILAQAYRSQNWALLAGLLLMAVVSGVSNLVLPNVDKEVRKWIAVGLSAATSIAVGLQTGQDALTIVVGGVVVGLTAVGAHQTIVKPGAAARRRIRRPRSNA